jgi:hypothetical protein
MFSETRIIKLLLLDNIFAMLCRPVFQQTVGIPVSTNCDPFLQLILFIRFGIFNLFL